MYCLIKETLVSTSFEKCISGEEQFVAVISKGEWEEKKEKFSMVVDLDLHLEADITKAEINYDSLTGSFSIPNRDWLGGDHKQFVFVLDENGIVFIDESGYVEERISEITKNRKWRFPSLERFIYDFIEQTVVNDLKILEEYETKLESIEDSILKDKCENTIEKLNIIRSDLLELRVHYDQLIDVGQELEENENNFFDEKNLRYFKLITRRIERYREQVLALREYSMQIRDLYQTHVDVKQNKTMTVLTVITTIFFPLSIITGWYGMNFVYMPELAYEWSYPILGSACILIIVMGLVVSKKKKWL